MRPDSSSGSGGRSVPSRWRAILVQIGLVATIATNVLLAGVVFVEIGILSDLIAARPVDIDMVETNTDRGVALGSVSLVILVVTAIAWWVWQYRAQANLRAMGRASLEHRPWAAVGWWLVPIASLWMPFKVMRELWKASEPVHDPAAWARVDAWVGLGWWWGLWITGNLLQTVSVFPSGSEDLGTVRIADLMAAVGLALSVFAACLAIGVIRQITERQRELSMVLATASPPWGSPAVEPTQAAMPPRPDLG